MKGWGGVISTHLQRDSSVTWFSVGNQTRGSKYTFSPASAFQLSHSCGSRCQTTPSEVAWEVSMASSAWYVRGSVYSGKSERSAEDAEVKAPMISRSSCLKALSLKQRQTQAHVSSGKLSSLMIGDLGYEFYSLQVSW